MRKPASGSTYRSSVEVGREIVSESFRISRARIDARTRSIVVSISVEIHLRGSNGSVAPVTGAKTIAFSDKITLADMQCVDRQCVEAVWPVARGFSRAIPRATSHPIRSERRRDAR